MTQSIEKTKIIENVLWLRLAQILVNEKYKKGDFKIPIHLALGHESIAVAVNQSMVSKDSLILSHRNIHYNLARMGTIKEELDEYYLNDNGLAGGHLGSMNLSNPKKNIPYTSSILGNNISVATGYALGNKMKNNNAIVILITGDGAIEEGSLWESLLFMRSNDISVMIIVENNQWSLGTKIEERRCKINLDHLSNSLNIDYKALNGNDPFHYIKTLSEFRNKSIKNKCPVIIEVHLSTLGYWYMETQEYPTGKFINYHAGPAPEVELEEYPIIEPNIKDPLHVLEGYLSKEELIKISSEQLKILKSELL